MRTQKRVFSLLLTATVALSTLPNTFALEYGSDINPEEKTYTQTFSDIPEDHWAFECISELVERGAISGYPDGKYYPDNTVTRQEFAKIMVVAAGVSVPAVTSTSFADVAGDYWAASYIQAAQPYMTAYASGDDILFKPTTNALREDVAVAVVKMKGYDTRTADLSILTTMFSDVDSISTSAQPYIALAVEHGLISGYTDGTFRGQNTVARSEAAAILWRAFQYGNDDKIIVDDVSTDETLYQETEEVETTTEEPTETTETSTDTTEETTKEDVLPYVVTTLTTADIPRTSYDSDSASSSYENYTTMDDEGQLFYYDQSKGQVLSLNPETGKLTVVLDVANLDYTTTGAEGDAEAGITYTDLTVDQIFWDGVVGQLLLVGEFSSLKVSDDGWSTATNSNSTLTGTFKVVDDSVSYISANEYTLYCALSNGTYVIPYWQSGSTTLALLNLENNEMLSKLGSGAIHMTQMNAVVQTGQDIYKMSNYTSNSIPGSDVYKYNFGSDTWDTQIAASTNDNPAYFASYNTYYQNGYFYNWSAGMIQIFQTSGNYKLLVDLASDVEVQDFMTLPSYPNAFFVTEDESFVFYDGSAKVIRMISPNPAA